MNFLRLFFHLECVASWHSGAFSVKHMYSVQCTHTLTVDTHTYTHTCTPLKYLMQNALLCKYPLLLYYMVYVVVAI